MTPPAKRSTAGPNRYPAIADYAMISDCHTAALISRTGCIDWCCFPRFDSGSYFGRLLDWEKGGHCSLGPVGGESADSRSYLDGTLVLETMFRSAVGEARLLDCFTIRRGGSTHPYHQLLRVVEGVRGRMDLELTVAPRFDYGGVSPWLRKHGSNVFTAIGGDDGLIISGDWEFDPLDHHGLTAHASIQASERVRLSLQFARPQDLDPAPPDPPGSEELDERLDYTIRWWKRWSSKGALNTPGGPAALRSAVVLKGLTNAPTGAIAAAPTTSLPEAVGGSRNWDYRFSWIRDSTFTVRALGELGFQDEADGFRRFVERSAAGTAGDLQIMYGVGGERRLTEIELDGLEGYRGSRPVRIGNAAAKQVQLDVYGELLELAWEWQNRGHSPDDDYWRFLVELVNAAAVRWRDPDRGLWEIRGAPRHFVHSKVSMWGALDRGIKLARECQRKAPERRWKKARDEIRQAVETRGYDKKRGVFVRAFGAKAVDAALLLLPLNGFVAYDDERMIRTTDAIRHDLEEGGLVKRYRRRDGLAGQEGTFLPCTFWLAECLAKQGRVTEAREVFDRGVATGNDLGLFAEEFDPAKGEMLGNFPQGLTHLSHIAAAVALAN